LQGLQPLFCDHLAVTCAGTLLVIICCCRLTPLPLFAQWSSSCQACQQMYRWHYA
jgi:hypothetical protein